MTQQSPPMPAPSQSSQTNFEVAADTLNQQGNLFASEGIDGLILWGFLLILLIFAGLMAWMMNHYSRIIKTQQQSLDNKDVEFGKLIDKFAQTLESQSEGNIALAEVMASNGEVARTVKEEIGSVRDTQLETKSRIDAVVSFVERAASDV